MGFLWGNAAGTQNRLLLPDVDFANPCETMLLTLGSEKVRVDDTWVWRTGSGPRIQPASFADEGPAADELRFIGQNRHHYAHGGFGWLSSSGAWVDARLAGDGTTDEKAHSVSDEATTAPSPRTRSSSGTR